MVQELTGKELVKNYLVNDQKVYITDVNSVSVSNVFIGDVRLVDIVIL